MLSASQRLGDADAVAMRALGFLAARQDQFDRFLLAAGASPGEMRQFPLPPRYMTAILDFLIADEALLNGFARSVSLPLEAAYEARRLVNAPRRV